MLIRMRCEMSALPRRPASQYDLVQERLSQGSDIEKRQVEKIRLSFQQFLLLGTCACKTSIIFIDLLSDPKAEVCGGGPCHSKVS